MTWYEHVLGVLAMLSCLNLVFVIALCRLSGQLSLDEEERRRELEDDWE